MTANKSYYLRLFGSPLGRQQEPLSWDPTQHKGVQKAQAQEGRWVLWVHSVFNFSDLVQLSPKASTKECQKTEYIFMAISGAANYERKSSRSHPWTEIESTL